MKSRSFMCKQVGVFGQASVDGGSLAAERWSRASVGLSRRSVSSGTHFYWIRETKHRVLLERATTLRGEVEWPLKRLALWHLSDVQPCTIGRHNTRVTLTMAGSLHQHLVHESVCHTAATSCCSTVLFILTFFTLESSADKPQHSLRHSEKSTMKWLWSNVLSIYVIRQKKL